MTPDPAESEVWGNQGQRQGPPPSVFRVPCSLHTPQTDVRRFVHLRKPGNRPVRPQRHQGSQAPRSPNTGRTGASTPGGPGRPPRRWREGRWVLPVGYTRLALTTPLEGKATGQLASGWRAPQAFLRPVSGTREPGGGDGGRPGLGARAPCPREWLHTQAVTACPHVRSTEHGRELRCGHLSQRRAFICSVPKRSRSFSGSSCPALGI